MSCTWINIIVFKCMLSSPVASDLCVFSFFLYQHITNPRKVVGQQDLMINNPLSQDEGVKSVFNMFVHWLSVHHRSSYFFEPHMLSHLKPCVNYFLLWTYCVVGSVWSTSVEWTPKKSWGDLGEREERKTRVDLFYQGLQWGAGRTTSLYDVNREGFTG